MLVDWEPGDSNHCSPLTALSMTVTSVIVFLDLKAAWRLRCCCRRLHRKILDSRSRKHLKKFVLAEKSRRQRQMLWQLLLLRNLDVQPDLTKFSDCCSPSGLRRASRSEESPPRLTGKWVAAIKRDVHRTMPTHPLFKEGNGERSLLHVLCTLVDRLGNSVGYCQGMNFIVATFLTLFEDVHPAQRRDALVVKLTLSLLLRFKLLDLYMVTLPQLSLLTFQLDALVSAFLPRLDSKLRLMASRGDSPAGLLRKLACSSQFYGIQWFLTLFSYDLPLQYTYKIWDQFLLCGWKVICKVGLSLLYHVMDSPSGIDSCVDADHLLRFLKSFPKSSCLDFNKLIEDMHSFKVTSRMLADLEKFCFKFPGQRPFLVLAKDLETGRVFWRVEEKGDTNVKEAPLFFKEALTSPRYNGRGYPIESFFLRNLDTNETYIMKDALTNVPHDKTIVDGE